MSDLGKSPPKRGGRVRLELREQTPTAVRYELTLLDANERIDATVEVALADGKVSGIPESGPPWMRTLASALLRTSYRQRETAGWPRRITRWRAGRHTTEGES
jgi:hypothetical protein